MYNMHCKNNTVTVTVIVTVAVTVTVTGHYPSDMILATLTYIQQIKRNHNKIKQTTSLPEEV